MTKSNSKKNLVASGLSLAVSAALLLGTTFAWFTDSVTSTGNIIQAGNLDIKAFAYDVADAGTGPFQIDGVNGGQNFYFETSGQDLDAENAPAIINDTLFEPGKSNAKLLTVSNDGTLAAKVKLDFTVEDGGLMDALWFDFVQVGENNEITGQFEKRDMSEITTFAQALELPLLADESVSFILVYGMDEEAGNEFMGKDFTADVTILATQYTSEEDGFGNDQYDAQAGYPVIANVSDSDSLAAALNNPGVPADITLTGTIADADDLTVTGNVTMNLGENRLNQSNLDIVGADIAVKDGGSLIINAVNAAGWAYTAGKLSADGAGSTLTVNGGEYGDSGSGNADVAARNGGVVYINDGSFSTSGYQGHAVTAESGSTVYIAGGSFSTSGAQSSTIYANGGTIVITGLDSISANGSNYDVDNGGTIILSKAVSASQPSRVGAGCTVADDGENWVITKA